MITRIEIISTVNYGNLISDVYAIDKKLTEDQLHKIADVLINPVVQKAYINKSFLPTKFYQAVEIGFLPGVTDNAANTAKEIIEDTLKVKFKPGEGVYTSRVYFFLDKTKVEELYNPLIQSARVKPFKQYKKDKGMDIFVPKVKLHQKFKVMEINLNVSDGELMDISQNRTLALDLISMKTIQAYFRKLKRNPTDIELESMAQTWSEHCKHTIFNNPIDDIQEGLFKKYIKGATDKINKKDFCASVFTDNSGAIEFNKDYLITHKVETHNSPSALDPFGGSVTGIVGVNRDTIGFGLGAKPIANFYGFCLSDPRKDKPIFKDQNLTQKMLSSRRIMDGVIKGVNSGGNQSGIPTPLGFMYFDENYRGKPLVFVGTLGLIPKKIKSKDLISKKAMPGDYIVMVGGRVGKDGIHGATFSSEALSGSSPVTAVQIGDPITQKKLSDVLIKEARDKLLYNSITDNGAGGLSCSVAEMAKECGGCEVHLEKVPLKYTGLLPWEIWVSESQERMTLAVPKNKWQTFFNLLKKRGVEAAVIGKFTNSGKCVVFYGKNKIMDIDMKFLHDGVPKKQLKSITERQVYNKTKSDELPDILSSLNLTSTEFITRQFDHMVQGSLVLSPLQGKGEINSDTVIIKPVFDSNSGVVMSYGLYPSCETVSSAIETAIRNVIAAGANPEKIALLDNFCWSDSNNPKSLGALKQALKECHDTALFYKAPFISGKDSMFNDFHGFNQAGKPLNISIPYTVLISSIGIIEDVTKAVSQDVKFPGDVIYIINDLKHLSACIDLRLIASSIGVGKYGLAVALAKMSMAGMLGIKAKLENTGNIVVTVNPKNKKKFESIMNSYKEIGVVTDNNDFIVGHIKTKVETLLNAYKKIFKEY